MQMHRDDDVSPFLSSLMNYSSLAKPTIALFATVALAACGGGAATTSAAPTPAQAPSSSTPPTSAAAAPAAGGLPAGVTMAMVTTGDSIFHARSCARCHGADAKGRTNGPDLTTSEHLHVNGSYDDFVRIITAGVPADQIKNKAHTIPMRARGGQQPLLTDDEVKAVAAYVYTLSHK